jgi:hypothetical protein
VKARPPGRSGKLAIGVSLATALVVAGTWLFFEATHGRRTTTSPAPSVTTSHPPAQSPAPPAKALIDLSDARPVLEAFRSSVPGDLQRALSADPATAWHAWAARHDTQIRARLAQGDEDSLVNFWLYGTTFTSEPRATARDLAALSSRERAAALLQARLNDLLAGTATPGSNERLRFGREVLARHGIDPVSDDGKDRAWDLLVAARERGLAETQRYQRTANAARQLDRQASEHVFATLYQDRGLSSDTRINADFALDRALEALAAAGRLAPGSVRRVAVIGPGLDFTDKAEGYDFYPQQTIQPFALMDSLLRIGFARDGDLQLVTMDLSARVNAHLESARARARAGEPYVVQLPLDKDGPAHRWHPDLVQFWQRVGSRIGDEVPAMAAPPTAPDVRMRAVRIRVPIVLSIQPLDLDIVVERLEPLAASEQFDVIVATNVLVYYDAFDQALALANIAAMLRPGGYFLTNYAVSPVVQLEPTASLVTAVDFDLQHNGDTIFAYQRR